MTNEEIDAEIARLTALKEQNNQTQTTENNKPADGIYNPADYIGQIANKMNKQSRNRGDLLSKSLEVIKDAGRRTGFEQDTDGTPLPETAYEWVVQQINTARARGPVNRYTLKAIENGAKVRYNVPGNFNISGPGGIVGFLNGSTERNMARAMNSMPYNDKTQKPAQPAQTPQNQQPAQSAQTQDTQTQQAIKTEDKPKGKQVANSNKGVAGASVGDFIVRSDGSTQEELDAMKAQGLSDDLYNKGIQAIKNGNGLNDEEKQFIQQYNKAANSRKPEDRAFLTSENVKRYSDLIKKQNEVKKGNGLNDEEKQFIQQYNKAANSRKPEDRAFLTSENVKRYNDLINKQNEVKKVNR